jgi:hypothetical protein
VVLLLVKTLVDPSLSDDGLDAINSPKFRKLLRSSEVMDEGKNTDLLEINPKLHISARILKKYNSKPISFEIVKSQIESELKLKKMAVLANQAASVWLDSYLSSDAEEKNSLLLELSKPLKINRNDPNKDLGKYKNALTGKTDEIFDYDFAVNDMKTLDLGRNGSLLVFLESSMIPNPTSSVVVNSLPTIYSNLNNIDSQISFKSWLNQAQSGMNVERYSERLVSFSSTSE